MRQWSILVVDDDPQIRELLQAYLCQHNFLVYTAADGVAMRQQLKKHTIDLVILDIMLPGEDGVQLCQKLREQSDVFILMLSAAGGEIDRVVGLEVGADDYMAKPFSSRELLARVKALQRRMIGKLADSRKIRLMELADLSFHGWKLQQSKRRLVDPDGIYVPLSAGEYVLLLAFLEHPNRVLTRDQLMELTRDKEATPLDRTIDMQVARLRKKIEEDAKEPKILITVRGGGYQFNVYD